MVIKISILLNASLIIGFYYLIKYYVNKNRLKISSYLNNYVVNTGYYKKKFNNAKKSLFSSIVVDKNKTIFEIGCGCGSNINYYPSGKIYNKM